MSIVRIYVEGVNDCVFVRDYLECVFGFEEDESGVFVKDTIQIVDITVLRGWDKLTNDKILGDFQDDLDAGIKSLVIIDADKLDNDESFSVRMGQVAKIKLDNSLAFDYFLIPNNEDDGCLETLLRIILVEENQVLLDCLDSRDACLQAAEKTIDRELKIPPSKGGEKSKIAQLRKFLNASSDYKDNSIWNLNHPYLNPLKEFLSSQLDLN